MCVHMHFRMKEKYFSAGWHNEFHNSIVLMHEIAFTPTISTFAELFRSKVGRKIKTQMDPLFTIDTQFTHMKFQGNHKQFKEDALLNTS